MTEIVIKVQNLSKCYHIYDNPRDRLKQFIAPRLQRLTWQQPKQYFREFWAVKDVSFEIKKGETVGIIGRNGSGKSTLLQMICGTLNPTHGSIETNGRIAALLELGSGFNPEFTGRENIYLNAAILGLSEQKIQKRFNEIVDFADIGDFLEQPIKNYSSGMVLRLAFSVSIHMDPDILIVDEALVVGDAGFQRKCFGHIEKFKERGGAILFCAHSSQMINELCDRAILIGSGQLLINNIPHLVTSFYHRLLNASPEETNAIRIELANLRLQADSTFLESYEESGYVAPTNKVTDSIEVISDIKENHFFNPNLISESSVIYESTGGVIHNFMILSRTLEQVNLLKLGKVYSVNFNVDFESDIESTEVEFVFKTITGNVIAGADTKKLKISCLNDIKKGSSVNVNFEFYCNLLPGSYLVSVGVRGVINGKHLLVHKIVEGILFRVLDEPGLMEFGFINLNITPTMNINN